MQTNPQNASASVIPFPRRRGRPRRGLTEQSQPSNLEDAEILGEFVGKYLKENWDGYICIAINREGEAFAYGGGTAHIINGEEGRFSRDMTQVMIGYLISNLPKMGAGRNQCTKSLLISALKLVKSNARPHLSIVSGISE